MRTFRWCHYHYYHSLWFSWMSFHFPCERFIWADISVFLYDAFYLRCWYGVFSWFPTKCGKQPSITFEAFIRLFVFTILFTWLNIDDKCFHQTQTTCHSQFPLMPRLNAWASIVSCFDRKCPNLFCVQLESLTETLFWFRVNRIIVSTYHRFRWRVETDFMWLFRWIGPSCVFKRLFNTCLDDDFFYKLRKYTNETYMLLNHQMHRAEIRVEFEAWKWNVNRWFISPNRNIQPTHL